MPELSSSNLLVLLLAAMVGWLGVGVLLAVVRLNRTYELFPSRFIYPANCKPEDCQDPAGFIRFMTPRLAVFGPLCVLICVFYLLNEFTGLLSGLPRLPSSLC